MLSLFICLLISFTASGSSSEVFYRELAIHHSPVVLQGQGHNPVADIFTRIDFDGDLDADNNWKNVKLAQTAGSFVYYDVIETNSHWFITYGFFYPRDYAYPFCFWQICHENDFEGMKLAVKKDDSAFGKVVLFENQAHGSIYFERNPEVDGHIKVVIESEGHGLYSTRSKRPETNHISYSYGQYELLPMSDLWEKRDQIGNGQLWRGTFDYNSESGAILNVPNAFGGKKWGKAAANPPWAWKPVGLYKGDWFFDPANSICRTIGCLPGQDSEYIFNPYLSANL